MTEALLDASLTVRDMAPYWDDSRLILSCSTGSSTPRGTSIDNKPITPYSLLMYIWLIKSRVLQLALSLSTQGVINQCAGLLAWLSAL